MSIHFDATDKALASSWVGDLNSLKSIFIFFFTNLGGTVPYKIVLYYHLSNSIAPEL